MFFSLPSAPLKPNNASAIFGGQAPYGLRAAEPSIFRPKDPAPNKQTKARKRVSRSNSDVGISKSEKRKSREIVVKRKSSESSRNGDVNKNNRPVSPRIEDKDGSSGDSPDGENGDRYPLFISVKKPVDTKSRKSNNENHCNGSPNRGGSESSPKLTAKSKKSSSESPFSYLRREKTDFIIRPRKTTGETGNPVDSLKREKSDIVTKRAQPSIGKARTTGSPSPIRREKSEITLKRSQPPPGISREKSDLVRPRGTSSPGPLRREKSDVSTKRTPPPVKPKPSCSPGRLRREKSDLTSTRPGPSSVNKDKTDVAKARVSTSPGSSLKREKSDLTKKKPPLSPSKSSIPKPRVSASSLSSPDPSPSNTLTKNKPSLPTASEKYSQKDPLICDSEASKIEDTENERAKSPSTSESTEKSEPPKKTGISPSKSGLPKPRVYTSNVLGQTDRDLKSVGTTCTSPEPLKHSREDVKEKSRLKQPEINVQDLNRDNFQSKRSSKETSDIFSDRSSASEIETPLEIRHRVSSPDSGLESNSENIVTTTCQSQTVYFEVSQSSNVEMSKIPTPTSTQVSRIPSLTKASTPPSKTPPKSKIPSFPKKSEEEIKPVTMGIPTVSEKPASKIPGLQRVDHAKENKDPALNGDSVAEANKHNNKLSRIPSATKTTTQIPRLPSSTTSQESQATETVETPKSRIPSISSTPSPNTSTQVSKIPSFGKHVLTKTPSKEEPESKISQLPATPKASGIPKPEVTPTGIPKPETKPASTESRIPQVHSPPPKLSGIPKPEVSVSSKPESASLPTESKIPTFTSPKSKIPAPSGSILARKDSEEKIKSQKSEESQPDEVQDAKSKETSSISKMPPPPPPRQDVSAEDEPKTDLKLSMDEEFFTKAKLMEELLRDEPIPVEIPADKDSLSKETQEKLNDAAEQMPTTKSIDEGSNEKETIIEQTRKEQFIFKSFGKKEEQTNESPSTLLSLGLAKEDDKNKESCLEDSPPHESKTDDAPTIDTLGQYEQQSRRSRSRQRKIISPDSEEATKTFDQTTTHESVVKTLEEDVSIKSEKTETTMKVTKTVVKQEKPKFVIESSIGADFYQSKSSHSKDSIADDTKAKDVVVIQNKAFDDNKGIPKIDVPNTYKAAEPANKDSAAFEDPEVSSNRESKVEMKAWSMEDLDEKTVKCYSCSRGGKKCSIM